MKVSKEVVDKFKRICMNEQDTPDEIVRYKIVRDFALSKHIQQRSPYIHIYAFGTLRLKLNTNTGSIVDIFRGKKSYKVSAYKKYKYDYYCLNNSNILFKLKGDY